MSDEESEGGVSAAPRIFVNQLDSYVGSNIAQHLVSCKPGEALDAGDDAEEDNEETGDQIPYELESPKEQKRTGYRVVGTLSNKHATEFKYAETIIDYEDRRNFYEHLFECDCIIYDITSDKTQVQEALWVATSLANDFARFPKKKIFILVTNLLTWLRSRSEHQEGEHPMFTEEEHTKRRPHPLYARQHAAEKTILGLGKKHRRKFTTFIVGSGIPYGFEQGILERYFKSSWLNSRLLEVYGPGKNLVPTIHIKDLSTIIQAVFEEKPDSHYIVARDNGESSLNEIIKAISNVFSTGEVHHMSEEAVAKIRDVPQVQIDQLTMDLLIEAQTLADSLSISWKCETGFVENIEILAQEYIKARGFQPLRICVLGPPFVGKTTIAMELCRYYGLHYIHVTPVLFEAYLRLRNPLKALDALEKAKKEEKRKLARQARRDRIPSPRQLLATATSLDVADEHLSSATFPPGELLQPDDDQKQEPPATPISEIPEIPDDPDCLPSEASLLESLPERVQQKYPLYPPLKWENEDELRELAKVADEELNDFVDGMLDDFHANNEIISKYLREKLKSKPCQNQGFVLDGYPTIYEEAYSLFLNEDDPNEDERNPTFDPQISPHHVINLEGSNCIVTHRYKQILTAEGITINEEIPDYEDPDGLSMDVKAELKERKQREIESKNRLAKTHKKKRVKRTLEELTIKWIKPLETPERRLRRRLEQYRSSMAPTDAADILEATLAPYIIASKTKTKKKDSKKKAQQELEEEAKPRPRKLLPPTQVDPMERNVLTYFDLRELHPFNVDVDSDKSKHDWLDLLQKEHDEHHLVQSMPRRNYLLKYVLPKVTECLVLYGQSRPSDPIDFLAEFLLQNAGVTLNRSCLK